MGILLKCISEAAEYLIISLMFVIYIFLITIMQFPALDLGWSTQPHYSSISYAYIAKKKCGQIESVCNLKLTVSNLQNLIFGYLPPAVFKLQMFQWYSSTGKKDDHNIVETRVAMTWLNFMSYVMQFYVTIWRYVMTWGSFLKFKSITAWNRS